MMSTRGSNDNIIVMLVFGTLYYLLNRQYFVAGLWYGLSVHFKIYPIIYCFVFYLFIDCDRAALLSNNNPWFQRVFSNFFTKNRIIFTLTSAFTFIALTGIFYLMYGYEFLYEAYLYHIIRRDNRHNYSVYWHLIYQIYDIDQSKIISILCFIPQWIVVISAGFAFYHDLFFAMVI